MIQFCITPFFPWPINSINKNQITLMLVISMEVDCLHTYLRFMYFSFSFQRLYIASVPTANKEKSGGKNHECNAPRKVKNVLRLLFSRPDLKKKGRKHSSKSKLQRHLILMKTFNDLFSTLPFPSNFLLLNPFQKLFLQFLVLNINK